MRRVMDQTAVRSIIAEMDAAGRSASARKAMARAALKFSLLTEFGRAAWQEVLA